MPTAGSSQARPHSICACHGVSNGMISGRAVWDHDPVARPSVRDPTFRSFFLSLAQIHRCTQPTQRVHGHLPTGLEQVRVRQTGSSPGACTSLRTIFPSRARSRRLIPRCARHLRAPTSAPATSEQTRTPEVRRQKHKHAGLRWYSAGRCRASGKAPISTSHRRRVANPSEECDEMLPDVGGVEGLCIAGLRPQSVDQMHPPAFELMSGANMVDMGLGAEEGYGFASLRRTSITGAISMPPKVTRS